MSETVDKPVAQALPHSAEAEAGVLGSMLANPLAAVPEAMGLLRPNEFYVRAHRLIFEALSDMSQRGDTIDPITLQDELMRRGREERPDGTVETDLDRAGGAVKVMDLFTFVPTASNLKHYAEIVGENASRRALITVGKSLVDNAYDTGKELEEVQREVENGLLAVRGQEVDQPVRPLTEYMLEAAEELEEVYHKRGKVTQGISTGFTELDRMTMGIKPKTVFVMAARSSHGKSTLMVQLVEHWIYDLGLHGLIFTLEDVGKRLAKRVLLRRAQVDIYRAKDGFLGKGDLPRMARVVEETASAGTLHVDERAGLTIGQVASTARLWKARDPKIAFVVVDYLQLVKGVSKKADFNRALEVAEVSEGMKNLAKDLDVVVLEAVQLNRNADDYAAPKIQHLYESGKIENDADYISLLHRPGFRKKKKGGDDDDEGEEQDEDNHAILNLVKHKDGAVGEIQLSWNKKLAAFGNADGRKLYGAYNGDDEGDDNNPDF